ncbi:DUF7504 family protein [Halorussus sp. AFM4]|uniref:DUF7504 family protein n=1 Tax=Halorussus sp. AFM4 TaxID=3421651 RepID=UPI003EB82915
MTASVAAELTEARNVLMLARSMSPESGEVHEDLLASRALGEERLLVLTFRPPERWVRRLRSRYERMPAETEIIALNETGAPAQVGTDDVSVTTLNPTDLTGVGMAVSDVIQAWAGDDAQTVVCFDSVTEFLQYADRSTMYRFLRVVTRRFDAVDGFAHFHMDPDAHDTETIATLKSPFDAIVDASSPDEVTVSTRF